METDTKKEKDVDKATITKDDIKAQAPEPNEEKAYVKTEKQLENENEKLKAKLYEMEQQEKRLTYQLEQAKEEKRKPGITVINEEDKQEKRKRPNSWGISDLMMPPYTKGRTAIYKIRGFEEKNPATELPVELYDVSIPGRYTLHDKFERDPLKKDKVIKNITGTEPFIDDGEQKIREKWDDIIFTRGWLQVPVQEEYPLYVFLELHPNNATNKFRPSNSPKIFERVDINQRSSAAQGAAIDLSLDAGNEVRAMNKEDVTMYAAATNPPIPTMNGGNIRPVHEVRTDLKRWAMQYPIAFYKLNKNAKAAIQINVLEAINCGLMEYQLNRKAYVDLESEDIICNHTGAEEPMDKLIKYLGSADGKEWYQHILDRLGYWSND